MAFRGLFIGIDRYADSRVSWLGGATRDAQALHALFDDTFAGDEELLADEDATAAAIRAKLADLAARSTDDDVVVVTYAGHGTEEHQLVTYDADVSDLAGSCISLDELADLLSAIPGKNLLCVLDCCFSGGLGARVLSPPLRARSIASSVSIDVLDRFVGDGRIVLTASADDEEALESPRHGHGLLTYRLLEALQGQEEVRVGDQISLYKLIEFVTRSVLGDAAQMGYVQTPALRGRLDGAPMWPVLTAGDSFFALFPDRARPPATLDLDSLEPYGVAPAILATWKNTIPTLNALQVSAINDYGVLDGASLVVTAPTSSGKTMIGELAAMTGFTARRRTIFLLPMRALVNDKYQQFTRTFAPMGVKTIRATGEHSDDVPQFMSGQFDIGLLTYEKFTALALGNPHVLDLAATVVVDEAQILADTTRGSNLEFLLTMLNNRRGTTGSPQIITLSAVVGDLGGLDTWLGAGHLHTTARPVELTEGLIDDAGSFRFLDPSGIETLGHGYIAPLYESGSRRLVIPLLNRLVAEGKKVIVFRQSKGEAVACAVYLAQALGLAPATDGLNALPSGDTSTSSATLRATLSHGVAFHNTDLDREERQVVEEEFRLPDSPLRVISATPTLAMGVNTPASAVVIVGLTHPAQQPVPYTVAEYKNMVGRAGRLGFTETGESFLIPEGSLDTSRAWNHYITGRLESLSSQLVPDGDPRSLMLRVLATYPADATGLVTEDDVLGFLDSSFAAFQARTDPRLGQWSIDGLRSGFSQLVSANLIVSDGTGYRLTELGRFTGESGVHVDSIVRLVHALRYCAAGLTSVGLVAAAQLTNELDDVYIAVNANNKGKGKNTEVPRWPRLLLQQGVPHDLVGAIQQTAPDLRAAVRRSKRAAAAVLWMSGQPMEQIETNLTQHLPQRGGVAGAVRSIADRTRDLLPAVGAVIREIAPDAATEELIDRTMIRLELGLPAELVDLVQTLSVDLSRRQWLALLHTDITTPTRATQISPEQLAGIVGSSAVADRILQAAAEAVDTDVPPIDLPPPTE